MFAPEVYEEIIEAWKADQQRGNEQYHPLDKRDLKIMFDTAFVASLKREEGRSLTFALTLLPRSYLTEPDELQKRQVIRLTEEAPLAIESVTKLASAFDSRTTALIVAPPRDESESHTIIGALFFYLRLFAGNPFEISPGRADLTDLLRPDVFTITARSAGMLVISRGDTQIGRFESGKFTASAPSPFYDVPIRNWVADVVSTNPGASTSTEYKHKFLRSLVYLVETVATRCHGATIVMIPDSVTTQADRHFKSPYRIEAYLKLEYLIGEIVRTENLTDAHNVFSHKLFNRECEKRLNILSQLACVDGALILSSSLEPVAFGARLGGDPPTGRIVTEPENASFDLARFGTRHKSAVDFVGTVGALAFVISEDGPIRSFLKRDDIILCYPDCRFAPFI